MDKEFGNLLNQQRTANRLTLEQLAKKLADRGCGLYSTSAISEWEQGQTRPPSDVVETLEDILMPLPKGLLLKAAGYMAESELRQLSMLDSIESYNPVSSHLGELSMAALILASNFDKYRNVPALFLGFTNKIGGLVYGGAYWMGKEVQGGFTRVEQPVALNLLSHLQQERDFPELDNIRDWADLTDDKITPNFIFRLSLKAKAKHFAGRCPGCP